MILVSACLAGETCRYDGRSNLVPAVRALVEAGKAVAVARKQTAAFRFHAHRVSSSRTDGS